MIRTNRRGSYAIQIGLSLPVLFMMSTFVIDIGYMRNVGAQYQFVLDSAAHSAVIELDGTDAGLTAAANEVVRMVGANNVFGTSVAMTVSEVAYGAWSEDDRTFTPETNALLINAVSITSSIEVDYIGLVPLFFGATSLTHTRTSVGYAMAGDWGVPEDSSSGLENGHFDVDTSSFLAPFALNPGSCPRALACPGCNQPNCETACAGDNSCKKQCKEDCNTDSKLKTDSHKHEYDETYHVTMVDVFNTEGGMDSIGEYLDGEQRFKIHFLNGDLSQEAIITINGVDINAIDYDDTPSLIYTLGGEPNSVKLADLEMGFPLEAIRHGGLMPTETGCVKDNNVGGNNEWRNGAFTIQIVPVNADNTDNFTAEYAWSNGGHPATSDNILFEITVFWHWEANAAMGMSGGCYGTDGYNWIPGPNRNVVSPKVVE